MKALQFIVIVLALALSSCVTVYKSGTPDDVYYSPANQPANSYSNTSDNSSQDENNSTVATNPTDDGGQYIVYDNSAPDENGISYTQRIQMFDNPSYFYDPYAFNNWYNPYALNEMYDPYYGYTPGFGLSFGLGGYYPYNYAFNSLYFGIGGFYNPWGSLWYPSYYSYSPYYGYGYSSGYGYSGKYTYNLRPTNTIRPRWSPSSRVSTQEYGQGLGGVNNSGNTTRVFTTGNTNGNTTVSNNNRSINTRRVFAQPNNNNQIPVINNSTTRTANTNNQRFYNRRVFTTSTNERPANVNNSNNVRINNNNNRTFQFNNNNNSFRQSAPERSINSSGGGGGAPVRTFRPRGGRR